jgi:hypothetical protein
MRIQIHLVLTLLIFNPLSAHAFSHDEVKEAIQVRASERHPEPNPTFWTNLGPESVPVMESMYKTTNSPVLQSTILEGLSYFDDPSIGIFLENEIPKSDNEVFKKKMLVSLIDSQGEASLSFVEPYLKDPNGSIRLGVALGLQRRMANNDRAQARLKRFYAEETSSWVKGDFDKATHDGPDLQKVMGNNALREKIPELKPLVEKEWAGDWTGVWVSAKKTGQAKASLSYLEKEKAWKVKLSLPKQVTYELKRDGMEVLYYTSSHLHWIEVRNKKDDSIFIGQRKP